MAPEIAQTISLGSESELKINKAIFKGTSENKPDTMVFDAKHGSIN